MAAQPPKLLEVRDLHVRFAGPRRRLGVARTCVRAVDGVSFDVCRGRTLGLVGESGCGKTTVGRAILRLVAVAGGRVSFEGADVLALRGAGLRRFRRSAQLVFQDPLGSLNPRMTAGAIVGEGLRIHRLARGRRRDERVVELLERVGLAADDRNRYPHEFSGGQCQRIGIARALALEPCFLVCDEPVSALDVSVQAQILGLLSDLQCDSELGYLFVAHDLAVVRRFVQELAVMYRGRIVESGPAEEVYARPLHPYTRCLLAAVPRLRPEPRRRPPPGPAVGPEPPGGCVFQPRCPEATPECLHRQPVLLHHPPGTPGHLVACHHAGARPLPGDGPPVPAESGADRPRG